MAFTKLFDPMNWNIVILKTTRLVLFPLILTTFFTNAFSQQKNAACVDARGYYLELSKLDRKGSNKALDTVRFHSDQKTKDFVLSVVPYYLTYVQPNDFKLLDPPDNSSPQTKAEIKYLLQLEKQRSDLEIQICKFMGNLSFNPKATAQDAQYIENQQNLFQIGRSIGTWFNPEQLPETAKLLGQVYQDASYFIWTLKYKYARIRPYTIDPTVHNLEDTDWPAYPSGHAGHSYVRAMVLSAIAPQYTDVFMKDAYDIAHSREIIGVHFPSDSEASRTLACQILNKLLVDKKFISDLEKAKKEWDINAREAH
jgi:acid phosphatase (class A)